MGGTVRAIDAEPTARRFGCLPLHGAAALTREGDPAGCLGRFFPTVYQQELAA